MFTKNKLMSKDNHEAIVLHWGKSLHWAKWHYLHQVERKRLSLRDGCLLIKN